MAQNADDRRLGEHLVTTGKLTSEELAGCFEAQQQLGGPELKYLGDVLVEQGHLTRLELQETLAQPLQLTSTDNADTLPMDVRLAMADPSRWIGRYVVLEELGRGGMGVVYRCYDPRLRRSVAIKMILDTSLVNAETLARFQREAQVTAKIRHPGIVAVHEVDEHQGQPFLVMDFVEGETFEALLKRGQLPPRRVADIVRNVSLALHHAHEADVIHRDVKPQNIMINSQGQPLVMDFGLARDTSARQQLTRSGEILGTPAYLAPEQADADIGGQGPWTDVYATGAMLYRALGGQPVFKAKNDVALLQMILMKEPRPLREIAPTVNPDLETIALKCLAKEPRLRYPSAAAIAEELQRFLGGQAILARPISRSERALRWIRRNRALSVALATVAVVVLGSLAGGIAMYVSHQDDLLKAKLSATRKAAFDEARARQEAREEATLKEQERARDKALVKLRNDVAAVLDEVRSGEKLADQSDREIAKAKLLKHRESETVRLLTSELDAISQHLATNHELSRGQELFLSFLCETLWNLGLREGAVASLGRYLETELSASKHSDQLRAAKAGKALCLLGGEEANRLVAKTRDEFGPNRLFWQQVQPFYSRTGTSPRLQAMTPQAFKDRGLDQQDKGDFEGAIADHSRAIDIDPEDAQAWNNRGIARYMKGDLHGAIEDYTHAIELNRLFAVAWGNRGTARYDVGDLDGAITDHTQSIELDPRSSLPWRNRGLALCAKGDFDEAIADFNRAIDIDPGRANTWLNRADAREKIGDFDVAMGDYNRAIELDPKLIAALHNRGETRGRRGDLDGAIADFTRAIELDPNLVVSLINRGEARRQTGDFDGAIADFTRALELDPNQVGSLNNRGQASSQAGDLDGAIADFTRAIELDPTIPTTWLNCGSARARKGDLDGAIADHTRAIEIAPDYAAAWYFRGYVLAKKGDLDSATADFTRAIEIAPDFVPAWTCRGSARADNGDVDGAIADFERALDLKPDHPRAHSLRNWIQNLRQGR